MSYAKEAKFDTVDTYARIGASIELLTRAAPTLLERAKAPAREVQGPRRQRKVA
ncbi:Uncharacterised protein [Serratia fonticola]|jgi:hypothetical protein|uniref:hypothetical protein n=1 Tax=Serratia sp. 14-2641 TaxID=1841657 RepID=UPI001301491C|nr:hypothetical protein [Serratia sp. 14-2641]CAI1751975.1 Uncharacterised protein [Serratia fonticola]